MKRGGHRGDFGRDRAPRCCAVEASAGRWLLAADRRCRCRTARYFYFRFDDDYANAGRHMDFQAIAARHGAPRRGHAYEGHATRPSRWPARTGAGADAARPTRAAIGRQREERVGRCFAGWSPTGDCSGFG